MGYVFAGLVLVFRRIQNDEGGGIQKGGTVEMRVARTRAGQKGKWGLCRGVLGGFGSII